MRRDKPTFTQCLAFGCAVAALLVGGVLFLSTVPVVEVTAVSGRCVQVLNPAPGESCRNLPKRYRTKEVH